MQPVETHDKSVTHFSIKGPLVIFFIIVSVYRHKFSKKVAWLPFTVMNGYLVSVWQKCWPQEEKWLSDCSTGHKTAKSGKILYIVLGNIELFVQQNSLFQHSTVKYGCENGVRVSDYLARSFHWTFKCNICRRSCSYWFSACLQD